MTYPSAVLVVALAVCGILLIEVVPQFQGVFRSFDAQLPVLTLWVIGLSESLQAHGLWLLLFAASPLQAFTIATSTAQPGASALIAGC